MYCFVLLRTLLIFTNMVCAMIIFYFFLFFYAAANYMFDNKTGILIFFLVLCLLYLFHLSIFSFYSLSVPAWLGLQDASTESFAASQQRRCDRANILTLTIPKFLYKSATCWFYLCYCYLWYRYFESLALKTNNRVKKRE